MTLQSSQEHVWSVSDFVAVFNQTIEYAYPYVVITGELANFRVSKNKWVYFDLKDEAATVRFFGTIYSLPGPLEDGMLLQVSGSPRLHPQFGFSVTIQNIQPVGEGSIKKASELLELKLRKEGLFDESRKRLLPYPPQKIGLIASSESAAYHDFMKILKHRWGGIEIVQIDVQVQGESSPNQIVGALDQMNTETDAEVIIITRGGGSPEDLAAFSHESVVRAVAASRIPTLVAIGHEVDVSLAELAADKRASTPSNAAELLVPDKKHELKNLESVNSGLTNAITRSMDSLRSDLSVSRDSLIDVVSSIISRQKDIISSRQQLLASLSPQATLMRGYAIIRSELRAVNSVGKLKVGQRVVINMRDGEATAEITNIDRGSGIG